MIDVRPATVADISVIQSIANVIWPLTFSPLMSGDKLAFLMKEMYSDAALTRQMTVENHHFLLAYQGDEAVAYCSYELNYRSKPQLMMHKLYILPVAQGSGLGRQMIAHLCTIARNKRQDRVRLQVLHTNERAMAFYEKLHFKKAGEELKVLNDDMGSFVDNVMMLDI